MKWSFERTKTDQPRRTLPVTQSYQKPEAIEVAFDDENLVANAGLLLVSTLAFKLGLDALISKRVNLDFLTKWDTSLCLTMRLES
jgi:hypothetical protein